jgi:hypothetical protein
MNKTSSRHGSESSTGVDSSKDWSIQQGSGDAPTSLQPSSHCRISTCPCSGNSESTLGWGFFFYVANVPGWLPVLTVVASRTTTVGRSPRTVRRAGNCVTRGLRALDRLTVLRQANAPYQSLALLRGMEGAFGMDRSSVLNEAGKNKESGEAKGTL